MYVVAVVAYLLLTRLRVGPFVDNDEYVYGNLAQSIAMGEGSLWREVDVGLRSLYPYVIAPAWMLADGEAGFRFTQAIGVVLMGSIVWPVWLASRTVVPGRWALIAPPLALSGIWMDASARVMTEALAIPAVTWSLCLALVACRRGSSRVLALATAFGLIAVLARPQAGAVVLAIAVALTLDVLRRPRSEWRAAAQAGGLRLGCMWSLVALGALAVAGPAEPWLGSYSEIVGQGASPGDILRYAVDHLTDTVFLVGVVPWVLVVALGLSRGAWRDAATGSYLSLAVAVTVSFVLVAGWFGASVSFRTIERYIQYIGPLLLVGLVPAARQVRWGAVLVSGGITALIALGVQRASVQSNEAQALHAFGQWFLGWPQVPGIGATWLLGPLLVIVTLLVSLAVRLRERPGTFEMAGAAAPFRSVGIAATLALALCGIAFPAAWQWSEEHRISGAIARTFGRIPAGLDRHIHGHGTMVVDTLPPTVPLWIEFFNKKIDRAVAGAPESSNVAAGYGPICTYRLAPDGSFASGHQCTPQGRRSYLFMTASGQIPTLRGGGRALPTGLPLVYSVTGEGRLVALRQPLCDEDTGACRQATITTFARRPSVLSVRFSAGQSPHAVALNGRGSLIEPGRPRTLRVRVGPGMQATTVQGDWQLFSLDTPYLDRVTLQERGKTPILLN